MNLYFKLHSSASLSLSTCVQTIVLFGGCLTVSSVCFCLIASTFFSGVRSKEDWLIPENRTKLCKVANLVESFRSSSRVPN